MSERTWLMGFEHRCENCKKRPAVVFFDCLQVCARCRQVLDGQLAKEATHDGKVCVDADGVHPARSGGV